MRILFLITFLLVSMEPVFAQAILQKTNAVSGQYIIQFEASAQSSARLIQQKKSQAITELRDQQKARIDQLKQDMANSDLTIYRNLWIRQSVAVSLSDEFLSQLKSLPYIQQIEPDTRYQVVGLGTISLSSGEIVQDNLNRIDIDPMWAADYQGQGVVVAILDSGVDVLHDDLATRWRGGTNSWFDPYLEHTEQPTDLTTGHGTGVASVVLGGNASGSYIGVAPKAQWIAARIFDDNGTSTLSAISESLQWILDPDGNANTDDYPDIVQNSWGLANSEGSCANPFAVELAAIDALGIDLVFAVGNSGGSGPSSFLTPAFDSHVISVGAMQTTDKILFSSSRGPDTCNNPAVTIPSVVAPGQVIQTADITSGGFDTNATKNNDGTSFSSPHVSGALALLRSQFKLQDHLLYRTALFDTAISLTVVDQNDFGKGRIQTSAASAALLGSHPASLRAHEINFSNAQYSFLESDSTAKVTVIRSGDISAAASVTVQAKDGTATAASDFTILPTTLNFSAGESLKTIDLQLTNDDVSESSETFTLVFSINNNVSTISINIKDDDSVVAADTIGGGSQSLLELMFLSLLWLGIKARP